jgi:uncharacterized delta-60 repeat protein
VTVAFNDRDAAAHAVAVQQDGRILVFGECDRGADTDFAVARLLPGGTLDGSFGVAGKLLIDSGGFDYGRAMALDSSGRILLGGCAQQAGSYDLSLIRLTGDGELDTSFADGGLALTDLGGEDRAWTLAADPRGGVYLAGATASGKASRMALVRFDETGKLDASFADSGVALGPVGSEAYAWAMALDGDGRILMAGDDGAPGSRFSVWRYTAAGQPDAEFSGDGLAGESLLPAGSWNTALGLALQADGRIVVAGEARYPTLFESFVAVARFLP